MYKVKRIGIINLPGQIKVNNILFDCGKDMAKKYDLHHWDNSHLKNFIIVALCELKNTVYLVTEDERFGFELEERRDSTQLLVYKM